LYAAAPWADERLTVKDGLALWFDALVKTPAAAPCSCPGVASGNEVDYLIDGSGHGRHLAQPASDNRPSFHQEFAGAYLSFDGVKEASTPATCARNLKRDRLYRRRSARQ